MYRVNEERMFYDLADNQAVVIDTATGVYYAMNVLGSMVFDYLAKGADPQSIVAFLKKTEGCPSDIETRMGDFVARALSFGLLEKAETSQDVTVAIDQNLMGNFNMAVDRFEDAVELMMADPVHDVDLEEGWPIVNQND